MSKKKNKVGKVNHYQQESKIIFVFFTKRDHPKLFRDLKLENLATKLVRNDGFKGKIIVKKGFIKPLGDGYDYLITFCELLKCK